MNLHCIEDIHGKHYIDISDISILHPVGCGTLLISMKGCDSSFELDYLHEEDAQEEHAKLVSLLTEKDTSSTEPLVVITP